jgi:methylamine dehydrogenase accessory protein MauD
MENALMVSNAILWVVVLALVLVVFALARQIGILYERVAPMGALTIDTGPQVGEAAPQIPLHDLGGQPIALDGPAARSRLVFFLSPSCPVCKKLLPILKDVRANEGTWLDVILASDGEAPEHLAFRKRERLEPFRYLLSAELGMRYRISRLPYAVLIDEAGTVRAKGLVNSREQLESLFTAKELGVPSIQEFIARRA